MYYIDYNLKYIKYLLTQRKNKKQTYGPNNTRHASFGLYLVVIAIQYPPSRVLRRLKLVIVRVVVVVVVVVHVAVVMFVV